MVNWGVYVVLLLSVAAVATATLSVDTQQRSARLFALHSAADTSMTLRACGQSAYATTSTYVDAWEEVDPLYTTEGSDYVSLRPADPSYAGQYLCLGENSVIYVNFPSLIYKNGSPVPLSMCVWRRVAGLSNSNFVSYQLGGYYLAQRVATQTGSCAGSFENGYTIMALSSTEKSSWPYATWVQTDASVVFFNATSTVNGTSAAVWMHICANAFPNLAKDTSTSTSAKLNDFFGLIYERPLDESCPNATAFSLRPYASSMYITQYLCVISSGDVQMVSYPSSAANCTWIHEVSGTSTLIKHYGTGLYLGWGTSRGWGSCSYSSPEGDIMLVSRDSAITSWGMVSWIRIPDSSSITISALPLTTFGDMFNGLILEDVNFEVDGGLYAELIHNRDFEVQGRGKIYPDGVGDKTLTSVANSSDFRPWTATVVSGDGVIATDSTTYPYSTNPITLKISSTSGSTVSLVNPGYGKIWCRNITFVGKIYVSTSSSAVISFSASLVDSTSGQAMSTTSSFTASGTTWKQLSFNLTGKTNNPSTHFSLNVTLPAGATVWLDHISLFPGDAIKGLWRKDIYNFIAAVKPKFIRFAGGLSMIGNSFSGIWSWNNTIGTVEARPGHYGDYWGYWTTDGMGLHEYLLLCESLDATPILTVFTGLKTDRLSYLSMTDRYASDAVGALTYANGATSTAYGSVRSSMGHSASFNLTWVGIGWEEQNLTEYHKRYDKIASAIIAAYPKTQLLASGYWMRNGLYPFGVNPCGNGSVCAAKDDHWQMTPDDMADAQSKYDTDHYSRSDPYVIVGRFSASSDSYHAMKAGLAEAVFYMGLQQNSDIVLGSVPNGPMFANRPHGPTGSFNYNYVWAGFNSSLVYGGCSYQMIKTIFDHSCIRSIRSTSTGDIIQAVCRSMGSIIVEMVNYGENPQEITIDTSDWSNRSSTGTLTIVAPQSPWMSNDMYSSTQVLPSSSSVYISENFTILLPAWSFATLKMSGLVPMTLPCQGTTCNSCLNEKDCVWCKAEKTCLSSQDEYVVLASATCQSTSQWIVSCPSNSEVVKIAVSASVVGFFFVAVVVGSGISCLYCRSRGRRDPKPINFPLESTGVSFKGLTPEDLSSSAGLPTPGFNGSLDPPGTNLGDNHMMGYGSPVVLTGSGNSGGAQAPIFLMPTPPQLAEMAAVAAMMSGNQTVQTNHPFSNTGSSSSGNDISAVVVDPAQLAAMSGHTHQFSGMVAQPIVLSSPQGQHVVYSGPQGQQQIVFSGPQGQQIVYSSHSGLSGQQSTYSGMEQQMQQPMQTPPPTSQ